MEGSPKIIFNLASLNVFSISFFFPIGNLIGIILFLV